MNMEKVLTLEDDFPGRLLHQAALWDNYELLEDLLKGDQKIHINSQDSWGRTPLHAAALTDKSKCLALLLESGADPDIPCGSKGECRTALHICADCGHLSNVRLLLQYNAKLTAKDKMGLTPLDLAERSEQNECVPLLQLAANEIEIQRMQLYKLLQEACLARDYERVKSLLSEAGSDEKIIVNAAPNGSNTLLFLCTEANDKDLVTLLLDHGADGRFHPVTKYSPLYIACYSGYTGCVEVLLKKFPALVRHCTVEKWLPIHAACIGGHADILELLLNFEYPQELLVKYCDPREEWEYFMPFDINMKDASGQTVLYLACLLGNIKMVEMLLKFKVKATKINQGQKNGSEPKNEDTLECSSKRRISGGIQNIMHRLNLRSKFDYDKKSESEKLLRPVILDCYCSDAQDTALHVAVRNKHRDIALLLLSSGADPNVSTLRGSRSRNDDSETGTCLDEACRNRDITLIDSLLKHGARDDSSRALRIAMENRDDILMAKLLAIRAHADPEYKLNKKVMTEQLPARVFVTYASLTYSSVFPNTPVMINWHGSKCQMTQIKQSWLIESALHVNPKLKLNPKNLDVALFAITRLDLSNNSLTTLPVSIFQLPSLRYLNLSQNKIEKLPGEENSSNSSPESKKNGYNLPVIEELCLQNNRLENVSKQIFNLPSLASLDLSNNKLQTLPSNMWIAPQLKELNVSLNLLTQLPFGATLDQLQTVSNASSDNSFHCDVFEKKNSGDRRSSVYSKAIEMKPLKHVNIWSSSVDITEQIVVNESLQNCSKLSSLNLAHNSFDHVPPMLACLAVNLTRLNMAYNGLKNMGYITSYPASIKQLDLSYNSIRTWFDFPSMLEPLDQSLTCYCGDNYKTLKCLGNQSPAGGHRTALLGALCLHRRHLKLDNLRTLIMANNGIEKVQLTLEKDVQEGEDINADGLVTSNSSGKNKFLYPNISMLDLSNNKLREIPGKIHELTNLSVLNISGNTDICELPPQMGLLSRLWNLNTSGCNLQEPLKSMIESKKYKTMDVIGYLKSILEDARPYARIKLMIVGVQGIGKTSLLEQLRQEGISYKRKAHDHWAKRMGSKNINMKTPKGVNMSTVGVDIGLWVYDKKGNRQNSRGPVMFRTWDFGGQREYYATHQYFLSKRSLYLVVWKIPDGQKGIREIRQWLVNIQARAPNSSVLIVGTHFDEMAEKNLLNQSEELQQTIRNTFINVVDAEKCGLPRVLETVEVSCKNRHNIKFLCNLIYDTVFSLKHPGSKELLLEQRVPASYLALEDVIIQLAADRRASGTDPVLNAEQYKAVVESEMQYRYHKSFRDWPELHQATLFLHENGVLLHYEDATLRNLYFLDPQWLCDMLAHVVTIREINPFARAGVMKLSDLKHVFKSSNVNNADTRSYIVNLLNKFEVALTWDNCSLLIPSLLPAEEDLQAPISSSAVRVKIPVRSRGWAVRAKKLTVSSSSTLAGNPYYSSEDRNFLQVTNFVSVSSPIGKEENQAEPFPEFETIVQHHPEKAIRRFLLMSYFPSGFWSRLITRMLADDAIIEIVRGFFPMPKAMKTDFRLAQGLDVRTEWVLWQTGMSLQYGSVMLFRMREILLESKATPFDYRQLKFRLQQEGIWLDMDISNSSILEIYFPTDSVIVKRTEEADFSYAVHLEPNLESVSKLLAHAVDHIDILLEDWYPTLGTRFVHTSEGKFLVTRLIPCPKCWPESDGKDGSQSLQNISDHLLYDNFEYRHKWHSAESIVSDGDSGVGAEIAESSRKPSVDDHPEMVGEAQKNDSVPVFSWMVEECILAACKSNSVTCPTHGEILLSAIAPDTMFIDLGERYLLKSEFITRGSLLGRGAFGFVFKGSCKVRGVQEEVEVALKMLQPVQPGPNVRLSALMAYKVALGKWDRDPLQYACKAYCTARQELNILLNLRHSNIVPLIGVCTRPLALILDLAPQGALDATLKNYRRSGAKIMPECLQEIILQVAKAIEYLHQQHIIYRDLKSENVLVWNIPPPFQENFKNIHVKLADYGISRLTLPSGSKGFGGTEGFMAPEIMKYNGEEEYTEKVDCFSFGMFIYELLTLHQPFEGHESVKECILEGGRPPLTYRETLYPSCILDLMVLCWSQKPKDRPSASQIVSIASSPEFTQLYDCTTLDSVENIKAAVTWVLVNPEENSYLAEFWLAGDTRINMLVASQRGWDGTASEQLPIPASSLSVVNNEIWMGDLDGNLYAFPSGSFIPSWKYALGDAAIAAILPLEDLNRVAVGLRNGRLFLVRSDATPSKASMAEGSFVMTELGSSEHLFSLAYLRTEKRSCEIWVGEASGYISIFTIKDEIVTGHDCVNHYNPIIEKVDRVEVVSCQGTGICSYVYPGCMVYQWETESREITSTLDCTKLVPCSESLKPLTLEDLSEKCQVTALTSFDGFVYVGTAWGCVIVAERTCLYPLMVFRPFEEEVKFMLPLVASSCTNKKKRHEIALGGWGYRGLTIGNAEMVLTPNQTLPVQSRKPSFHILLWKYSQHV